MPTYEYKCTSCGNTQELFLSMSDALKRVLVKCTECNNIILEKQISGSPNIQFKGSGFYVNDSKNTNKPKSDS